MCCPFIITHLFADGGRVVKQVRDDVRLIEARVFRLDVEDEAAVLHVVVEADLRPHEVRAGDLLLELGDLLDGPLRDGLIERAVVLRRDAFHALEGELRELRPRV